MLNFSKSFGPEGSPVEGQSLQQKDKQKRKRKGEKKKLRKRKARFLRMPEQNCRKNTVLGNLVPRAHVTLPLPAERENKPRLLNPGKDIALSLFIFTKTVHFLAR